MNPSITPAALLEQMAPAAAARFASDAQWAAASSLPRETLSRLKRARSCDLRTLAALARAAGCTLAARPVPQPGDAHLPVRYDREVEETLLDFCASGTLDPQAWRAAGPAFFMGGLAVLLAGARGFDRERHLRLAEALHPGISTPEAYVMWLERTPVAPARFLPMLRRRRGIE